MNRQSDAAVLHRKADTHGFGTRREELAIAKMEEESTRAVLASETELPLIDVDPSPLLDLERPATYPPRARRGGNQPFRTPRTRWPSFPAS